MAADIDTSADPHWVAVRTQVQEAVVRLEADLVAVEKQRDQLSADLESARGVLSSLDRGEQLVGSGRRVDVGAAAVPSTESGSTSVPDRVLVVLRKSGPGTAWTARELTTELFGADATRSTLEGVRKAALRLVARGEARREGSAAFVAAQGADA